MITDLSGSPIQVGDYIVQAFNLGRSAALKYAKVVKVRENGMTVEGCKRCVTFDGAVTWRMTSSGSIKCPERSLVIPRDTIPKEALEILDGDS